MTRTITPPLRAQSYEIWLRTIREELEATRQHIAALEVTTAAWRNELPRVGRCERSWA